MTPILGSWTQPDFSRPALGHAHAVIPVLTGNLRVPIIHIGRFRPVTLRHRPMARP